MRTNLEIAKSAFKNFADRHDLHFTERSFSEVDDALDYMFGVQDGLFFELSLGFTGDELHIGYQGFWTYIFPLDEKIDWMVSLADGIIENRCRLAIHKRRSVVRYRVLEEHIDGAWVAQYGAVEKLSLPFQKTQVSYIYNTKNNYHPSS